MDNIYRLSHLTKDQKDELLRELSPEELPIFFRLENFAGFISQAQALEPQHFIQLVKAAIFEYTTDAANDAAEAAAEAAQEAANAAAAAAEDKAEREAFAQLPPSGKIWRRSHGPSIGLGAGIGVVTMTIVSGINDVTEVATKSGLLIGIGTALATYGVVRLLTLAACEVMRRGEETADRPAYNPAVSADPLNHDKT